MEAADTSRESRALAQLNSRRSVHSLAEALAEGTVDQVLRHTPWDPPPSLRRTLIDLIEEYARHVGHADLIRESVDGLVREDPA